MNTEDLTVYCIPCFQGCQTTVLFNVISLFTVAQQLGKVTKRALTLLLNYTLFQMPSENEFPKTYSQLIKVSI